MKPVLAFGPRQLAEHVGHADFDVLAEFLARLASEVHGKTIHVSKSRYLDSFDRFITNAKDCLLIIGDPYEPLKEDT
jgi:hypothetical protein